ncbi:hypothetical protein AWB76_05379 [Caballeronia temeraria]|uniref:Uncharacterized protein n=1 Tax=Caballeronia temeraria TaxID=1777137 RepID=A0A158CCC5_9BURK|nr:hypothetical protein [Caballeronia temeraria]SAK79995.1 hypothetical protein AWB76_05379 [Caballeronia temeraria]
MRASTLVSLRTNAVLIALCVAASDAAWFTVCGCAGHIHAIESITVRLATLASAAGIVLIVRRIAKLEFDAARAASRIAWTADRLVIDGTSPGDWLVQLHVELHPAGSRLNAAHACPHAAASCRVPRGRA